MSGIDSSTLIQSNIAFGVVIGCSLLGIIWGIVNVVMVSTRFTAASTHLGGSISTELNRFLTGKSKSLSMYLLPLRECEINISSPAKLTFIINRSQPCVFMHAIDQENRYERQYTHQKGSSGQ